MELLTDGAESTTYESLAAHVRDLHERMMASTPSIARVACTLYDPADDTLKTFVNSTRDGEGLRSYEAKLSESYSLSMLAATGRTRVLTDLPAEIDTGSAHSNWVLGMGYKSSVTIPLTFEDRLLGFLFFDSADHGAFTAEVQRELSLYGRLISLAIANELIVIRSVLGSVQVAREFAQMRDIETGEHMSRMARYARLVARAIAPACGMPDEWVEALWLYAPLHDIGKIGIPDSILLKPGPLTPDERAVMQTHTTIGLHLVNAIAERLALPNRASAELMRHIVELHHERLDGSGYPHGLVGDAIPLEAQVVAVADVFDALTAERPYKRPWTNEDAVAELRRMVDDGRLRADAVEALATSMDKVRDIQSRFSEDPGA